MGRVIKLVIYYFLYNLVFMGVVFGVYGFVNHTSDMPQSGPVYFNLSMWVQLFATLALGIHLLAWKYVTRKDLSFDFPNTAKVLLASVVLSVGMGLWTNYLTELTELPNVMEDLFNKMMYNPLGVISIVVMAPIVEELLFRGLPLWKNFCSAEECKATCYANGRIPPGRFWCLPSSSASYMAIPCKCFSLPSWDWYWAGYITAPEACCPAC